MPTYDSGSAGMVGTAGVTIYNADATLHTARATTGISELVAGSGVLFVAHPAIGTPLIFVWDKGVGTVGASETTTGVYDTLGYIEYTEPGTGVTLAEALLDVQERTPILDLVSDWITNKLVQTNNNDGTWTIQLMADDDVTPLKTWTYTEATETRAKAV